MDTLRLVGRILCTLAILVVGPLTGVCAAMALFMVNGTLRTGEPLYVGSTTPPLSQAIVFSGLGLVTIAGLAFARHKLGVTAATSQR
jgi:hypothetical protein